MKIVWKVYVSYLSDCKEFKYLKHKQVKTLRYVLIQDNMLQWEYISWVKIAGGDCKMKNERISQLSQVKCYKLCSK